MLFVLFIIFYFLVAVALLRAKTALHMAIRILFSLFWPLLIILLYFPLRQRNFDFRTSEVGELKHENKRYEDFFMVCLWVSIVTLIISIYYIIKLT